MTHIAIIDYGMGNLRSVAKAIEHVAPDAQVIVTSDPRDVARAERVVFPGQGAMPDCMRELDARGAREAVVEAAATKPFLGICIGQQMLFEHSEEGDVPGLGILPGRVVRFPSDARMSAPDGMRLKVPHMGWNEVRQVDPSHPLWRGIADGERFYFVHSFHIAPASEADATAHTDYGVRFTSAVGRANIFAVQFHPEKSATAGLQLLANFVSWNPEIPSR
ncbi:imidazole glycerol phosphate synthase subunit HisH [Pseudazoarcus pumilus]|uniref:Imidazole glycerol phosphate synthase subunit HisH n=1 Tax=Pseudazoarcus pumilus TaxID=2067960 RepID=A0A2I6S5K3_9RHOO|nr:imidazole glycerol phosphate synthase subunit HisH [Pseudazoarcus pumilus]AUN94536.1 imidazole glycerol phosphate synthase subunit HisH [Pseudazoarcus pumilus]